MFYKTIFKKTTFNETCLNWCELGIRQQINTVFMKLISLFISSLVNSLSVIN